MQRLKRIFKVTMMVVIFLVALGSIRSFLDRGSDRGSFRASAQSLPPLTKSTGPFHPAATEFATIDIYNPTNTPFSGSWAAYDAAGNPLIGPTSITVPAYAFSSTNFTTPLMSETRTCSSNLD